MLGVPRPGVSQVGYYLGLTEIVTQQGLDRKIAELHQAPYYILPTAVESPFNKKFIKDYARILSSFARAGIYPLPLHAIDDRHRLKAPFIAMLYQKCRPRATSDQLIVCGLK